MKVQKIHPDAMLPTRGSEKAAGLDLHAVEDCLLHGNERLLISTGIAVEIPPNHYGRIAPRSSLAVKNGIDVLAGVVDEDYRGEVKVALINHSKTPLEIKKGDRIAQLIITKIELVEIEEVESLEETERAAGGFGSTGK